MLFRSLKLTWQRDLMLVHMIRQHLCQCIFALPRRAIKSYDIHIRESPNKCAIKLKTRNPTKNRHEENRPWWGGCSPRGTRYAGGSNRPMAALRAVRRSEEQHVGKGKARKCRDGWKADA